LNHENRHLKLQSRSAEILGTGVIDISCVPDAASLTTGYGTFDTGAVDMVGTVI